MGRPDDCSSLARAAFRKVARVRRSSPRDTCRQGAGSGAGLRHHPQGTLHSAASSCSSNGSACGPRCGCSARSSTTWRSRATTSAPSSAANRSCSCARTTARCAPSTTCAMHRGNRLRAHGCGSAETLPVPVSPLGVRPRRHVQAHSGPRDVPAGRAASRGLAELPCDTWGSFVWFSFDPGRRCRCASISTRFRRTSIPTTSTRWR